MSRAAAKSPWLVAARRPTRRYPVTGTKESGRSAGFSTADSHTSRESADGRSRFAAIYLSDAPVQHMLFTFRHAVEHALVPLEGGRTWLIVRGRASSRILMDQGIYMSMLVFAAGLRHLIRQARRRRRRFVRRLGACDVRRSDQSRRLLQRRRLGARDRGELPADDLVLDGQRHSDPAMWHGPQLDSASGLIEMETNHVSAFGVQDS
jgi:hypothetical protein